MGCTSAETWFQTLRARQKRVKSILVSADPRANPYGRHFISILWVEWGAALDRTGLDRTWFLLGASPLRAALVRLATRPEHSSFCLWCFGSPSPPASFATSRAAEPRERCQANSMAGLRVPRNAPDVRTSRELEVHPRSCLLYTSPSPRDKRQSRMPSSA